MPQASQVAQVATIYVFNTNPANVPPPILCEHFKGLLGIHDSVVVRGDSPFDTAAIQILQRVAEPRIVMPTSDAISSIETNATMPNIAMRDLHTYFE